MIEEAKGKISTFQELMRVGVIFICGILCNGNKYLTALLASTVQKINYPCWVINLLTMQLHSLKNGRDSPTGLNFYCWTIPFSIRQNWSD